MLDKLGQVMWAQLEVRDSFAKGKLGDNASPFTNAFTVIGGSGWVWIVKDYLDCDFLFLVTEFGLDDSWITANNFLIINQVLVDLAAVTFDHEDLA